MAVLRQSQRGGQHLQSMPDSALVAIFRLLPPLERRTVVPLVCKRFAALAASFTELWEQVQLSLPEDFRQTVSMGDLYSWFVRRESTVRSLHASIGSEAAWTPLLAVLGIIGRRLEHLRVAGDGQSCVLPGCTAPWLALTPSLRSLELDDVCDHSIGEALWPPGGCTRRTHAPPCLQASNAMLQASKCGISAGPICARGCRTLR